MTTKSESATRVQQHYVFGYGSLINVESRNLTGLSGYAIPARVQGWRRGWDVTIPHLGMTALGVARDDGAATNGVLIPIAEGELSKFDARESGYDRIEVSRSACAPYRCKKHEQVWIYVPHVHSAPTVSCPIVQSYVDVVMAGCIEVGENFAREFVRTTTHWDRPWTNDRENPRYPRAARQVTIVRLAAIDRILSEETGRVAPLP